jgi:hypothetical protein
MLALLCLSLAFASFFLVTLEQFSFLQPVVEHSTAYLPVLLLPLIAVMAGLLLLRYLGKDKSEEVDLGDFFAGFVALALQLAVIIIWRAQGNEIAGHFAANVPDVAFLSENASKIGVLGVAALQLLVLYFYAKARPDRRIA